MEYLCPLRGALTIVAGHFHDLLRLSAFLLTLGKLCVS